MAKKVQAKQAKRKINRPSYKSQIEELMGDFRTLLTELADRGGKEPEDDDNNGVEPEDDDQEPLVAVHVADPRGRTHQNSWNDRHGDQSRKVYRIVSSEARMYPTTERVFAYLKKHPDATRREIASGTGVNANTCKFALRQLIHMGMVQVATRK